MRRRPASRTFVSPARFGLVPDCTGKVLLAIRAKQLRKFRHQHLFLRSGVAGGRPRLQTSRLRQRTTDHIVSASAVGLPFPFLEDEPEFPGEYPDALLGNGSDSAGCGRDAVRLLVEARDGVASDRLADGGLELFTALVLAIGKLLFGYAFRFALAGAGLVLGRGRELG